MTAGHLRPHGGVRGDELAPGSSLFEGRFGRMFRRLPGAEFSDGDLKALADKMTAPAELDAKGKPSATPESEIDDEENQGIDAGYTYLGQFIDHDLTFDPNSSLQKANDPDALTDFRTPRFDLDCVYGRGPDDQPYLYEDDGLHLKLGRPLTGSTFDSQTRDLPRHSSGGRARALIGDPRNDENVIVSQLHGIMLRFHNRMVSLCGATQSKDFARVQQAVRWHYQWIVLHDFLPTILGTNPDTLSNVLPHLASGKSLYEDKPKLNFYKWQNAPFIPIEFSAAVYRFGHSMIRPIYRLSTTLVGPGPTDPINGRLFIFTPDDGVTGLNGFREFPSNWAIDWSLFFDMGDNRPPTGITRVQRSYKIDTSVVNPLAMLPQSVARTTRSLPLRNLERGASMGLPAGQTVARYLDLPVIAEDKLVVGKANLDGKTSNQPLTEISKHFDNNAPLWTYILAEAQQQFVDDATPIHLGPVGGRIIAEVFAGLLLGDQHAFLSQEPSWKPDDSLLRAGQFRMADLIRAATQN